MTVSETCRALQPDEIAPNADSAWLAKLWER
jgi:hypothetical protein